MNLAAVLLLSLIGALVAAGAAWTAGRLGVDWNARQRVFNSAAIAPTIVAVGAACFALVMIVLGGDMRFAGANEFLVQALIATLAAFDGGLIAAYIVERTQRR